MCKLIKTLFEIIKKIIIGKNINLECYTIFMRDLYNDVGSETITFPLTYIAHCYNERSLQ